MENAELIAPSEVAELHRESLLPVLNQVEEIYKALNDLENRRALANYHFKINKEKYEEILNQVSAKTRRLWTIIGWIAALCSCGVLLIPWYFLRKSAYEKDRERNRAANEQAAQNYYAQSIAPLEDEQKDIQEQMKNLEAPIAWARDIVTSEIFNMGATAELRILVEKRRADTLKEALNLFDSNRYRERMESIQKEILANSDATAEETAKQTVLIQETEKSARQTAAASKWTAVNTYRSYKIQKKQYKNDRRNS